MALVLKDRTQETTSTTGTSDFVLTGAVAGFQAFSAIGDGNTTYYAAYDSTGGAWEVGIGTYTLATTTLARTTVKASSTGSKISFTTAPAVWCDAAADLLSLLTSTTGSGSVVLATSPTLVTPVLGVATATSINKVALTAPATSATLTIADGKTLTASNTLTLTATDGSTLAIGTGGTLGSNAYTSTAIPAAANPTGSIGLSAVNGVATTYTRSDSTHALDVSIAPTWSALHTFGAGLSVASGFYVNWNSDAYISRLASKSVALAGAASASPGAYTLTIGEASRGGTDTNIAGANAIIQSGLGTGNAAGSKLQFKGPLAGSTGTTAQSYSTLLEINGSGSSNPNSGNDGCFEIIYESGQAPALLSTRNGSSTGYIWMQTGSYTLSSGSGIDMFLKPADTTQLLITTTGSVVCGSAAVATNAANGFLYIATCAGTPTGTPTTRTGHVAMVYDTTNHQFWIYDGGWLQPKTPAAAAIVNWQ